MTGPTAVVVVGSNGYRVRAYDPDSRATLWEDLIGPPVGDATAWHAALDDDRVYIVGRIHSDDLLLRAYDLVTGVLAWEQQIPDISPHRVALRAGRLFVVGSAGDAARPQGTDTYAAAFDTDTGSPLWHDVAPAINGAFLDVAVRGTRVVAVGSSDLAVFVRAYDTRTGVLAWEDHPARISNIIGQASAIDLSATTAYIVGSHRSFFPAQTTLLVRADTISDGTVRWEDQSRTGADRDVVAGPRRLFVAAGQGSGLAPGFIVRAYDLRGDE